MKHPELLMIVATVFAAAAAQAQIRSFVSGTQAGAIVTDSKQPRYIRLGTESSGWYGNKASIHVTYSNFLAYKGKRLYYTHRNSTSLARFDEIGQKPIVRRLFDGIVNRDGNGVTVTRLYRTYNPIYRYVPGGVSNDYSNLGRMSFARVGNTDVYFGDWADVQPGEAAGSAGTNYSVFYNGTGKTAKMPTSGKATYAVKGINNYVNQNSPIMAGTLTADFDRKRLNGTIAKKGLNVAVNNAVINTAQASFSGTAKANNSINGKTHGHFYGNNAAALAGVAEFAQNPSLNTAFGGVKK